MEIKRLQTRIDRLDNVYHNSKEVEKLINLPILGLVPFFNFKLEDVLVLNNKEEKILVSLKKGEKKRWIQVATGK